MNLPITEEELKKENPWRTVADMYIGNDFLYAPSSKEYICKSDKGIIDEFNKKASEEAKYILNVPTYPWLGNPLKAKVIILSLNPGYSDRERKIALLLGLLKNKDAVTEYAEHLRKTLTFDVDTILPTPENNDKDTLNAQDIANLHGSYYWYDRLKRAFGDIEPNMDTLLRDFAVIQYVGYSSRGFKDFGKGKTLPSQDYTKKLISYILENRKEVPFIITRSVKLWEKFLGEDTLKDDRFIIAPNRAQSFRSEVLEKDKFNKIIEALSKDTSA
jgi:hypothetical protein